MNESAKNPAVDAFINAEEKWRAEFTELRRILLDCPLEEQLKWGVPCYTHRQKNVVLMHGFKEYCALLFVKGALLKDPRGILIRQTLNVQTGRQIRFTGVREILELEPTIRAYADEAVEIEKAGRDVPMKEHADFAVPEELRQAFMEQPALKAAFEALTPGRQRAYLLFFSEPKQSKTRTARIEKHAQRILGGKGLNDV